MRTAAACFALAVILGGAAQADEALTPGEFRTMVQGRTVHYTVNGQYYGSEQFYSRNQVTWQNPSGACEHGHWWKSGKNLCFRYGVLSCWKVYRPEERNAYAVSRSGFRVEVDRIDDTPLLCEGEPVA